MRLARILAGVALCAVVGAGVVGCEKSRDEMRPDMDKVQSGEAGLQSRDLREMTDRMAPDLLQISAIANNPNRVTVVMKPIENRTSNPGEDMTIYVARLKVLLNTKARDRMAFVEESATLSRLQAEELGNQTQTRIPPQYVLYGTFYEKNEGKTSYFLCTFRMTDIKTGEQVWENSYETKTLNSSD